MRLPSTALLALVLWLGATARAQAPVQAPGQAPQPGAPVNLVRNGDFAQGLDGWTFQAEKNGGTATVVAAQAGPFKRAVRVVNAHPKGSPPWLARLEQPLSVGLKAGRRLMIKAWMRSPDSARVGMYVEIARPPFDKSPQQELALTPQWQEYQVPGYSLEDTLPQETTMGFWLAFEAATTVEVAGVRVWELPPQPQLDLRVGHGGPVQAVAASADGKLMATESNDQSVRLWDASSGTLRRVFETGEWKNFAPRARALALSPDGLVVASSAYQSVRRWDTRTGAVLPPLVRPDGDVYALAFSPDGSLVAGGGEDKLVRIWDARSTKIVRTLAGHTGPVFGISFSKDGKTLETSAQRADAHGSEAKVWDVATGKLKQSFDTLTGEPFAVALSPDAETLASGGDDNTLRLWNVRDGSLASTCTGSTEAISTVAFSPEGSSVAAGGTDRLIRLWSVRGGALRQTLSGHNSPINTIAFTRDGATLVSGSADKTARLWDLASGTQKGMLGRVSTVFSIALSPDGGTLAVADEENAVFLWDRRSGELKRTLSQAGIVMSAVFSPDGKYLVSAGTSSLLYVWDARSGALLRTLSGHVGRVWQLAFSPDGQTVASAGDDATVKMWDVRAGVLLRTLAGHQKKATAVAFSPDGQTLLSGSLDGTIKVWDTRDGSLKRTLSGYSSEGWISRTAIFSPDGKTIAGLGSDLTIKLWDAASGALRGAIPRSGFLYTLAFSPDGKSLVGGSDRWLGVWDVASATLRQTLTGHSGLIMSLCFAGSSQALASGGEDQVKLWDISAARGSGGRLLATLYALAPQDAEKGLTVDAKGITADAKSLTTDARGLTADARTVASANDYVVATPEGYYMGSASADRTVQFRLGQDSFPAESFQARYYRPDLVQQSLAGHELPAVGAFHGPTPPTLSFAEPLAGGPVSGPTVSVAVSTSDDSDVSSVVFFVNGNRVEAKPIIADSRPIIVDSKGLTAEARPVQAAAEGSSAPAAPGVTRRFTATLALPAEGSSIKVQAIALDNDGLQSARQEILFTRDAATVVSGKLLGLCVGVSQYQDPRLNLKFADADATAVAAVLNQQRGLYLTAQVAALTNEAATSQAVRDGLDALIARTSRADTVVVLLSGHGWRDEARRFYFATHEVNRNDVAHSALPWSEVIARLTTLSEKSKRVIVLLDACHSGSAATNDEMVKAILGANAGVLVFASSRGSELSLENGDWGHGAFTKALLEAMSGQASPPDEKSVTTIDFIAYVSRRVKALTANEQHPQVPFLQDFESDAPIMTRP